MDIFPKYISSSLHFLNWETQRGSHNPYYHLPSWGANTGWRWPLALCMAWQGHSAVRILVWFSRLLLHQGVGGTRSWDRIHDSDCGLATKSLGASYETQFPHLPLEKSGSCLYNVLVSRAPSHLILSLNPSVMLLQGSLVLSFSLRMDVFLFIKAVWI